MTRTRALLVIALFASTGCKSTLVSIAAGALSGGSGSTFASDNDPELVKDALPFALKSIESLAAADPSNEKAQLAACSSFLQYAYAFVSQDADRLEEKDLERSKELKARAKKLYVRALGHCHKALDDYDDDFWPLYEKDRKAALARFSDEDEVPYLYWTAMSWAALITANKDDMQRVGELKDVEAIMARAYEIEPDYDVGAIHEFYVAFDGGRSEMMGGSVKRAKEHLDRVLQLSKGHKLAPLVTWAESVDVAAQNRKEFNEMLDRVLAFNVDEAPELRLVNLIAQDRARRLKAKADDLFLEE